jgi:hypothetical protein
MEILQLEKPIRKKRTAISQAFDEVLEDLPIHRWCLQNEKRNKTIRI